MFLCLGFCDFQLLPVQDQDIDSELMKLLENSSGFESQWTSQSMEFCMDKFRVSGVCGMLKVSQYFSYDFILMQSYKIAK